MMNVQNIKINFVGILILISSFQVLAQPNLPTSISDQARYTLVTGTPGSESYNMFGHSAIRLIDPSRNIDWMFNYGTFDFGEPGFVLKFIQRKLLYKLSISSYKSLRRSYEQEGRGMYNQAIRLDAAQRQALYDFLRENYVNEDQRYYLYDFFYDNCATRIRDALYQVLEGEYQHPPLLEKKSFRNHLKPYMTNKNWTEYGIDLGIGMNADKKCDFDEEMFLPDFLSANLSKVKINNQPLLGRAVWDLPDPGEEKQLYSLLAPFPIFGFTAIALIMNSIGFQRRRKLQNTVDSILFIVFGLAGCFLLFLWFGTDHIATQNNLNVLWLNPLYLLYIPLIFVKKQRSWFAYLLFILFICNAFSLLQFVFYIQQIHWANFLLMVMLGLRLYYRWKNHQQRLQAKNES